MLVPCAFLILTVPGFAGPPAPYDSVVAGKDDPACDVQAVQDAVDKGGSRRIFIPSWSLSFLHLEKSFFYIYQPNFHSYERRKRL